MEAAGGGDAPVDEIALRLGHDQAGDRAAAQHIGRGQIAGDDQQHLPRREKGADAFQNLPVIAGLGAEQDDILPLNLRDLPAEMGDLAALFLAEFVHDHFSAVLRKPCEIIVVEGVGGFDQRDLMPPKGVVRRQGAAAVARA